MSLTTYEEYAQGRARARAAAYNALSAPYQQKLERIQWNYSRDLNEKQFAANKKDEELLAAVEGMVNMLIEQVEQLEELNKGLHQNLNEEISLRAKLEFNLTVAKHKLLTQKIKTLPI